MRSSFATLLCFHSVFVFWDQYSWPFDFIVWDLTFRLVLISPSWIRTLVAFRFVNLIFGEVNRQNVKSVSFGSVPVAFHFFNLIFFGAYHWKVSSAS